MGIYFFGILFKSRVMYYKTRNQKPLAVVGYEQTTRRNGKPNVLGS